VTTNSGAPYENRIIVRRPADRHDFSGTVVVELMNMTNRWDLDRMWLTSHDQYLRAPATRTGSARSDPGSR
jgi:hypothetical protein